MKKQLDVNQIQSELRGNSAFFPGYKSGDSPTPLPQTSEKTSDQEIVSITKDRENVNLEGVPPVVPRTVPRPVPLLPKVKRPIRQRQPFDIYEDQYQTLKKIAASEKEFVNGRGMSQMVREAIDQYLKAHSPSRKK